MLNKSKKEFVQIKSLTQKVPKKAKSLKQIVFNFIKDILIVKILKKTILIKQALCKAHRNSEIKNL
jgi:hypothetical protein